MRVWHGRAHPLGATWDGRGVNVAVFSEQATNIDLCLFDSVKATRESARLPLPVQTGRVWHGYFPDVRPGQLYGLRADGPYDPRRGLRCNVNKLLFDPYAKAVVASSTSTSPTSSSHSRAVTDSHTDTTTRVRPFSADLPAPDDRGPFCGRGEAPGCAAVPLRLLGQAEWRGGFGSA